MKIALALMIFILTFSLYAEVIVNHKCYGVSKKNTGNYDLIVDAFVFEDYILIGGRKYKSFKFIGKYENLIPISKIENPVGTMSALFEAYEDQTHYKFCIDLNTASNLFTGKLIPKI